jgi:hypothetical protein
MQFFVGEHYARRMQIPPNIQYTVGEKNHTGDCVPRLPNNCLPRNASIKTFSVSNSFDRNNKKVPFYNRTVKAKLNKEQHCLLI